MNKKTTNKLDPNQVKLNLAILAGLVMGWVLRRYVTQEFGVEANFLDAVKHMITYIGGPSVGGAVIVYGYEKVYRPWREGK